MSIPGFATAAGTAEYAKRFQSTSVVHSYRELGRTDWKVSKLGFGTYRCQAGDEVHFESLRKALEGGINLIDTSANYMDGQAESLIAEVLNKTTVWGELKREQVVLVSKVGYIQGENMRVVAGMEKAGSPFPEVVKINENLWHCIHPMFIEDQLTRSLSRLHLDTIDLYLLHNPEYFFRLSAGKSQARLREEFYRRIRQAFLQLEKLAEQGFIRYYGISSNSFPLSPEDSRFVSLAKIWAIYEEICLGKGISTDEGHFAAIQFPYNWLETEGYTLPNNEFQGTHYSLMELAKKLNLGVITNRPLNAFKDQQLFRLAKYPIPEEKITEEEMEATGSEAHQYEKEIVELIREWNVDIPVQSGANLSDYFQNVDKLRRIAGEVNDPEQFDRMLLSFFIPILEIGKEALLRLMPPDQSARTKALLEGYAYQMEKLARRFRWRVLQKAYRKVAYLEEIFDKQFPDLSHLHFSQKALLFCSSTPGVDSVLNGMRRPEYVQEALELMRTESLDVSRLL